MNIEEAIEVLKMWNKAEELIINESTDYDKTVYIQRKEAIETLLIAYEKEKEKNKDARERIEYYLVGNFTLNDFDKRNKELRKIEKILGE